MKENIKRIQRKIGVAADGIVGPKTVAALMDALGVSAPVPVCWPSQREVRSGKSVFGAPGGSKLVKVKPPYPLFYEGKPVEHIGVHEAVAEHVEAALREVLAVYGLERIKALGLDQYGGCYNYRSTTGGSSLSMHAWGIALDWCPERNAYKTKAPAASLSAADCVPWWEIWEKHGAVSMGRVYDKDWMHVQFARFND
jgi:hypothetical protein